MKTFTLTNEKDLIEFETMLRDKFKNEMFDLCATPPDNSVGHEGDEWIHKWEGKGEYIVTIEKNLETIEWDFEEFANVEIPEKLEYELRDFDNLKEYIKVKHEVLEDNKEIHKFKLTLDF